MWRFKNHQEIGLLDMSNSLWSVLQSTGTSDAMLVRVNDSALEWAKHPQLSIRVGFAVPLDTKKQEDILNGSLALNKLEDSLCKQFEAVCQSIHALTISTKTFKEFVFYINNPDIIEKVHKQIINEFPSHEIQCFGENDSDWKVYFQFKKQLV